MDQRNANAPTTQRPSTETAMTDEYATSVRRLALASRFSTDGNDSRKFSGANGLAAAESRDSAGAEPTPSSTATPGSNTVRAP